jgi:hypothetical protein
MVSAEIIDGRTDRPCSCRDSFHDLESSTIDYRSTTTQSIQLNLLDNHPIYTFGTMRSILLPYKILRKHMIVQACLDIHISSVQDVPRLQELLFEFTKKSFRQQKTTFLPPTK